MAASKEEVDVWYGEGPGNPRVPVQGDELVGEFEGELGTKHHLIALASCTVTGIERRWWLSQLMEVHAREGAKMGPVFGCWNGSVASIADYDDVLHGYLKRIQAE